MMVKLREELDGKIKSLQDAFASADEEYHKTIDPTVSEFQKAYEMDSAFDIFVLILSSFSFFFFFKTEHSRE